MLARQREKSHKYFNLSISSKKLNNSNLRSTLGAMKIQKWEHFSGLPSRAFTSVISFISFRLITLTCDTLRCLTLFVLCFVVFGCVTLYIALHGVALH